MNFFKLLVLASILWLMWELYMLIMHWWNAKAR